MNAIVEQARTYLGIPHRHRGRSRRAVDCAGLPICVYADLGVELPDLERYGREPHKDGLMQAVVDALGEPVWKGRAAPREILEPGDIVVMRFVEEPHHLAIVTDDRLRGVGIIHSYSPAGGGGRVVEHGLDAHWQSLIVAVFRRPI